MEDAQADGRRHSLNTRTTRQLRGRLEAAAAASGRSLAQEVEARLEKSFAEEDLLLRLVGNHQHDMLVVRTIAAVLRFVQEVTGKKWSQDFETLRQCQMAVEQVLFGIWGGSRRDHPRKSQSYIDRIDAKISHGLELATMATQNVMADAGLGYPYDKSEGLQGPPSQVTVNTVSFASDDTISAQKDK